VIEGITLSALFFRFAPCWLRRPEPALFFRIGAESDFAGLTDLFVPLSPWAAMRYDLELREQ
jgi:hypothetical protein